MRKAQRAGLAVATVTLLAASAIAQKKQEFHIPVSAGASVTILNAFGPITVRPSNNNQVSVVATPHSDKVEVDQNKNSTRLEFRTHVLQKATPEESRVDYEVQVPVNVNLTVRSSNGPIIVDHVNGDVTSEGESSPVQVRDGGNGHVHIRTVDGPVALTNLKNAHVEVASIGGDVNIVSSTGPSFSVNTTKGKITYDGDFDGGGDYSFSTHMGDIDVMMPANSSVDLWARSVNGTVQDVFQLQPEQHPSFAPSQGKSFAGTANSGASSVKLRTFSGKITVKKSR
jgi:DUF4097 and DUF4098 domain-containing protein YvlB